MSLDGIRTILELTPERVNELITEMELKGKIKQVGGVFANTSEV
jgi:predicted Rossmann fold nucleotide-binding protein DprA/Smf involved in DNA uptake